MNLKQKAITCILCAFFLVSTNVRAQSTKPSRSETESWLLSKMNEYVSPSSLECHKFFNDNFSKPYECLTYTGVKFNFQGDNLMITCQVNLIEYQDSRNVESNFQRTVTIPLASLDYLYFITTNSISFSTKYSAIKVSDSPGKSSTKMFFTLSFESDQEENLAARFLRAMENLKGYLKNNKPKETF